MPPLSRSVVLKVYVRNTNLSHCPIRKMHNPISNGLLTEIVLFFVFFLKKIYPQVSPCPFGRLVGRGVVLQPINYLSPNIFTNIIYCTILYIIYCTILYIFENDSWCFRILSTLLLITDIRFVTYVSIKYLTKRQCTKGDAYLIDNGLCLTLNYWFGQPKKNTNVICYLCILINIILSMRGKRQINEV